MTPGPPKPKRLYLTNQFTVHTPDIEASIAVEPLIQPEESRVVSTGRPRSPPPPIPTPTEVESSTMSSDRTLPVAESLVDPPPRVGRLSRAASLRCKPSTDSLSLRGTLTDELEQVFKDMGLRLRSEVDSPGEETTPDVPQQVVAPVKTPRLPTRPYLPAPSLESKVETAYVPPPAAYANQTTEAEFKVPPPLKHRWGSNRKPRPSPAAVDVVDSPGDSPDIIRCADNVSSTESVYLLFCNVSIIFYATEA